MGAEKTPRRTGSRAQQVASRCDGTAEGTDVLLRALLEDRLNGAIGGKVTRDCCRVIGTRINLARNVDPVNSLYERSRQHESQIDAEIAVEDDAELKLRKELRVRELEAELAALRTPASSNSRAQSTR